MSMAQGNAVERLNAVFLRQLEEEDALLTAVRAALAQARENVVPIRAIHPAHPEAPGDAAPTAVDGDALNRLERALAESEAGRRQLQEELAQLREQLAVALASASRAEALAAECDHLRRQIDETYVVSLDTEPADGPLRLQAFDGGGHKKRMGRILVEAGLLQQEELDTILGEQKAHPQRRFGRIAVEHGFANEEIIARVLAAQLELPYVDLDQEQRQGDARLHLNGQLARHYQCFPLRIERHSLIAAIANPLDLIAIENIELATGYPLSPVVAVPAAITRMIEEHYRD
ncbi:MAG: hypothetical protein IT368_01455 [Candidatus Hydrogenedentes bacterium]|nr:hypothetical protein [Candidatus Hydrogenedentota bacterium]